MKRIRFSAALAALVLVATPFAVSAQHSSKNVTLHINTRWDECAFQLDPALTQSAWREFTEEAALVSYLRPLTDARPLGRGHVEFSVSTESRSSVRSSTTRSAAGQAPCGQVSSPCSGPKISDSRFSDSM